MWPDAPACARGAYLGTTTEDKAEDDPAEVADVVVHVGCVIGPDLFGRDWNPFTLDIDLNALAANSNIAVVDWLAVVGIAAGDTVSRYPFGVELGMVALVIVGCGPLRWAQQKTNHDRRNEQAKNQTAGTNTANAITHEDNPVLASLGACHHLPSNRIPRERASKRWHGSSRETSSIA